MERVVCLIVGYVFGLFQTAVLYGKMKGVDIRNVGSKNAGTTNTLRVMGAKAGLVVLLGDMFKCIFAIILTYFLFGRSNPDRRYFYMIYTAAGAVLGHDFPFFLKFKGGKGIACTAGYIISMVIGAPIKALLSSLSISRKSTAIPATIHIISPRPAFVR